MPGITSTRGGEEKREKKGIVVNFFNRQPSRHPQDMPRERVGRGEGGGKGEETASHDSNFMIFPALLPWEGGEEKRE